MGYGPHKIPGIGDHSFGQTTENRIEWSKSGLGWVLTHFRPVTRGSSYTNRGFILSALTIEVSHGPEVEFCFPWACRRDQLGLRL